MACTVFMTCTTFMLVLKKPLALLVASSVGLRRRCNFEQRDLTIADKGAGTASEGRFMVGPLVSFNARSTPSSTL